MNTENNQPEWVAEVLKIVGRAQKQAEIAVEAFNATAAKSGLVYAIEWRASDVAATEGLSREVAWLGDLFTSEKHSADLEAAAALALKEIESIKQRLLNGLRVGASTSAFANAIENAKLEARARAFDTFGGVYAQVCHIIKNRNQ